MISLRVDEDDFIRLDTLARQTSCSRAFEKASAIVPATTG
jgi:predicted transcriptional regulator